MKKFSIEPNEIVIPITQAMGAKGANIYDKFSYSTRNPFSPIDTAQVAEQFPFDLAFSMTVHKAHGGTIKRVVLDLTSHPTAIS